ncbi:hypothetical protein M9458_038879, partial [Cirrhinus mrigala]
EGGQLLSLNLPINVTGRPWQMQRGIRSQPTHPHENKSAALQKRVCAHTYAL